MSVRNWATDFDHFDPAYAADPFTVWDELRTACPVARSERFRNMVVPTRHAEIEAVARDTVTWSSRSPLVADFGSMADFGILAPPISSDPPFYHGARRLLLFVFFPKAVEPLEPFTRAFCHSLVDAMGDDELIDGATQYAQDIPVRVIAKMLGFPAEDADQFRDFVHTALEAVDLPVEERFERFMRLDAYLTVQVQDHIDNPRDDLTSYLLNAEMDGQPLNAEHVRGSIALLLIAGIDTTWSAIGASLWHLATTPADRERLVAEPDLLPFAVEEFLRAYAPVTMARLVKEDFEFEGCPMKKDDWVLLPFPAANRDPEFFDRADEVILDREENRHAAFGLGIHRCAGSNLARMEMRVALEVFLERIPSFELADPGGVRWSGGQVRGPRALPLRRT